MYKPVCCSVMLRVVSESRLFMQNLPEHYPTYSIRDTYQIVLW